MVFDPEWQKADKKIDPNFEGSIFQKLGYDEKLCPTCGAHLYEGICLNTCHLGQQSQMDFVQLWNEISSDYSKKKGHA